MRGPKYIYNTIKRLIRSVNEIHSQIHDFKFQSRRAYFEEKILHSSEMGVTEEKYCDTDIIVSLTTYGKRLGDVCYTIESLMQQTRKANRIILWLDEQTDVEKIPAALRLQEKRGLEIRFTKDIRSYTKLIPALKDFPNAAIITVDDDLVYDFDILDRMISTYKQNPKKICACRIHSMSFDSKHKLLPYNKWKWNQDDKIITTHNFLTGVGGVLYPPHSLHPEVLNESVFREICPTADDVWFAAMALKNGTEIIKVTTRSPRGEDYIDSPISQEPGLCTINVGGEALNDRQIKAVFEKYDIYSKIK